MTEPASHTTDITLVSGAIHNPNEPRHFMRLVAASGRHTATIAGERIADSTDAVFVKEVGFDIYDPVIYFPRRDVVMDSLIKIDKTTHCPLKGDTDYFDIVVGGQRVPEAAWSYVQMVSDDPQLDDLAELVAFDQSKVDLAIAD